MRYTPIAIPMRDGKFLAADLYSIDTTMAKPVILIQTPYNKNRYRDRVGVPEAGGSPFPYDSVNYTYVVVDWRGRFGSKDAEVPGYDLGLDGYDCVEWIVRQRWCNGKVGLWGSSALGQIQFLTAKHQPPHLVCAVPLVRDYKTNYEDYFYGGVYRKEHVESLALLGFVSTQLILSHPSEDLFWQILEMNSDYPESINVPMLLIGGWYDHFPDEVMRAFDELRTRSDPAVRQKHKLMIGPWLHMELGKLQQGGLEYPNAVSVHDSAAMQFFDYYLRGIQNGYEQQPVVRYYQMGSNGWQSTGDWNSLSTSIDTLYLHPGGLLLSAVPSQSAA
ncbi:MAG: CocE/NonD family hydrolase, partial [Bacteroidales bacterium]